MQDARDVICQAAKGHVEEIARRREIKPGRMYEILGKDNPYPKSKLLIRDIAAVNLEGVRLVKADMDALWSELFGPAELPAVTAQDLHREAFEAVDALLAGKPAAECMKELRELIAIAQLKLDGLEKGPRVVNLVR